MKKIVCELCESTEFAKDGGMFICQGCGMKYSVEEAKSLMKEVDGEMPSESSKYVSPINNADRQRIDNLLSLANSSFSSKNYAQAEEFCNQVIAIDSLNYEAWKLKGEAINYQINANNQRILEVYNCIMTSFRVLDDEGKEEKKYDILSSLKDCFEGEIVFWLEQFEANRPTDAALTRAKNAYIDSYNKMAAAFDELGLEESKEGYLINFDNYFVGKCNATCNSAWESTVGYNYYRDYRGGSKDPFGRSDQRWVIANTDLYRPTQQIWETFLEEADNLIELLQFAEEQFNDETDPEVMEAIYSNIAYFEECIIPSGSWEITQGYTSNWDQYKTVGWHESRSLAASARDIRRGIVNEYRNKEQNAPKEAAAKQQAKREQERKDRVAAYWEENKERKEELEAKKEKLLGEQKSLENEIAKLNSQISEIEAELGPKTESELEEERIHNQIQELYRRRDGLGLFAGKEKKQISAEIGSFEEKLNEWHKKVEEERDILNAEIAKKVAPFKEKVKQISQTLFTVKSGITEINEELNRDPEEE